MDIFASLAQVSASESGTTGMGWKEAINFYMYACGTKNDD
jgi:hypothetical protein